jgi:hypothetical protein
MKSATSLSAMESAWALEHVNQCAHIARGFGSPFRLGWDLVRRSVLGSETLPFGIAVVGITVVPVGHYLLVLGCVSDSGRSSLAIWGYLSWAIQRSQGGVISRWGVTMRVWD